VILVKVSFLQPSILIIYIVFVLPPHEKGFVTESSNILNDPHTSDRRVDVGEENAGMRENRRNCL